jgi:hypothetical protein
MKKTNTRKSALVSLLHRKYVFIPLVIVVSLLLSLILVYNITFKAAKYTYGVSYSPEYATTLGLDWQKTYLSVLDDLQVRHLRISTYWDIVEPYEDVFDFYETDFLIQEAAKRDAKILLVLGNKQPRWPECHTPLWAKEQSTIDKQRQIKKYIQKVVERYKNNPAIWGWQVENEPLFGFGDNCETTTPQFLKDEVDLVRKLDPSRPIVLTDSGEWQPWRVPMQLSDIFGTTLYRSAYFKFLGFVEYPFPPFYYSAKSYLARHLFAPDNQKTIIAELQTEPWFASNVTGETIESQVQRFPVSLMQRNVEFARQTGFDEIYLWGVEWWYYQKSHNHPEYYDLAKLIFLDQF